MREEERRVDQLQVEEGTEQEGGWDGIDGSAQVPLSYSRHTSRFLSVRAAQVERPDSLRSGLSPSPSSSSATADRSWRW
eukprot:529136-Hanusia_phi.AAC.1